VALLFGTRDRAGEGGLAGLPGLVVEGLPDADARALLASVLPGRLDRRVRDRIIGESGGNPLALLELPRGATAAELAGGFGLPGAAPLPARIEGIFKRRLAPLPAATRLLLLLLLLAGRGASHGPGRRVRCGVGAAGRGRGWTAGRVPARSGSCCVDR